MSDQITKISGYEVLDSRGNPTVECQVFTENGKGRFIVPSGASTGKYEAVELRDKDNRYNGNGVRNAVRNVNEIIAKKLIGTSVNDQEALDATLLELDGTEDKSNLGANAILATSIAAFKASAMSQQKHAFQALGNKKRLPCPMLNVINGGKHAGGDLAIQEFMIMPTGFNSFSTALQASVEVYHTLKKNLKQKYGKQAVNVGDEGGFTPAIKNTSEALVAIENAIEETGYQLKKHFFTALDSAASEFYTDGKYSIDGKKLTPPEFVEYYRNLHQEFPALASLEDPFEEDDFQSFSQLKSALNNEVAIVGDDLTVTNKKRIKLAIKYQSMNYLLLKINQIGTLTEAKEAFNLTKAQGWKVVISHRSGDTEDPFIADLAVGLSAERVKFGAPARSERVAKYNQLLRIERELGENATYYTGI